MSHFIKICKVCQKTISQCRCIKCDKDVIFNICDECTSVKKKNSINLYLIFKRMGIHIFGIVGVYNTEEDALIALADAEDNDLHDLYDFTIEGTVLNNPDKILT